MVFACRALQRRLGGCWCSSRRTSVASGPTGSECAGSRLSEARQTNQRARCRRRQRRGHDQPFQLAAGGGQGHRDEAAPLVVASDCVVVSIGRSCSTRRAVELAGSGIGEAGCQGPELERVGHYCDRKLGDYPPGISSGMRSCVSLLTLSLMQRAQALVVPEVGWCTPSRSSAPACPERRLGGASSRSQMSFDSFRIWASTF